MSLPAGIFSSLCIILYNAKQICTALKNKSGRLHILLFPE